MSYILLTILEICNQECVMFVQDENNLTVTIRIVQERLLLYSSFLMSTAWQIAHIVLNVRSSI